VARPAPGAELPAAAERARPAARPKAERPDLPERLARRAEPGPGAGDHSGPGSWVPPCRGSRFPRPGGPSAPPARRRASRREACPEPRTNPSGTAPAGDLKAVLRESRASRPSEGAGSERQRRDAARAAFAVARSRGSSRPRGHAAPARACAGFLPASRAAAGSERARSRPGPVGFGAHAAPPAARSRLALHPAGGARAARRVPRRSDRASALPSGGVRLPPRPRPLRPPRGVAAARASGVGRQDRLRSARPGRGEPAGPGPERDGEPVRAGRRP